MTATTSGGIATFVGLTSYRAGSVSLVFSAAGYASVTQTLVVSAGPNKLVVHTQAAGASPSAVFTTQPVVAIADADANTVSTDSSTVVTVSTSVGTLSGSLTAVAKDGLATFSGVSFLGSATVATLTYTSSGLQSVTQLLTVCASAGYSPTKNGGACVDVNECTKPNTCAEKATCSNSVGSFTCACNAGWTGSGTTCVNVNECATTGACPTGFNCADTVGSFTCTAVSCGSYGTVANGQVAPTTPISFPNSVTLSCVAGYALTGTGTSTPSCGPTGSFTPGQTCADINECGVSNGGCSSKAVCSNTVGSRTCQCGSGYEGTGLQCADVNECAVANGGCHASAACSNTQGSRTCSCNTGFTGSGTSCQDIDECSLAPPPCDANAQCTNAVGSFSCQCRGGYGGTGLVCAKLPAVASAVMSDSLVRVDVTFDSPTDMGRNPIGLKFGCSRVLASVTVAKLGAGALCLFSTSKDLQILLGDGCTLQAGHTLGLGGEGATGMVQDPTGKSGAVVSNIQVQAPRNPPQAKAALSCAAVVSGCGTFQLDARASSGGGARGLQYQWSIVSGRLAATGSNALGSSKDALVSLDKTWLQQTSTFRVTVSNGVSSHSAQCQVAHSGSLKPSLRLVTDSSMTVTRAVRTIKLTAAYDPPQPCSAGETVNKVLKLQWTPVSMPGYTLDPKRASALSLVVPTDGLPSRATFQLRAWYEESPNEATTTPAITVNVNQQALVAAIEGGHRVVGVGSDTLVRSSSVDPDDPSGSAKLVCSWTCVRKDLPDSPQCFASPPSWMSSCQGVIAKGGAVPGVYTFGLSVRDPGTGRTASASAALTFVGGKPVEVMLASLSRRKVNAGDRLHLSASVSDGATDNGVSFTPQFSWAVTSGPVSDTYKVLAMKDSLVLEAHSLLPGKTYTFQVTATAPFAVPGAATTIITTNVPPSGGGCSAHPSVGIAAMDVFSLACSSWTDEAEDLPLLYSWNMVPNNAQWNWPPPPGASGADPYAALLAAAPDVRVSLVGPSPLDVATSVLPAGGSAQGAADRVLLVGCASDQLGATSCVPVVVQVKVLGADRATEASSAIAQAAASQDVGGTLQRVAAVGSSLLGAAAPLTPQQREDLQRDLTAAVVLVASSAAQDDRLLGQVFQAQLPLVSSTQSSASSRESLAQSINLANQLVTAAAKSVPDSQTLAAGFEVFGSAIMSARSHTDAAGDTNATSQMEGVVSQSSTGLSTLMLAKLKEHVPGQEEERVGTSNPNFVLTAAAARLSGNTAKIATSDPTAATFTLSPPTVNGSSLDAVSVFYGKGLQPKSQLSPTATAAQIAAELPQDGVTGLTLYNANGSVANTSRLADPVTIELGVGSAAQSEGVLERAMYWDPEAKVWSGKGCLITVPSSPNKPRAQASCFHLTDFAGFAKESVAPLHNIAEIGSPEDLITPSPTQVKVYIWNGCLIGLLLIIMIAAGIYDIRQERLFLLNPLRYAKQSKVNIYVVPRWTTNRYVLSMHLYGYKLLEQLKLDHEILQVVTAQPWSLITRAQVVICAACGISGTIMCSAMFIGTDESHAGQFIVVGFISVMIATPAPFLLDLMFKMVRRRNLQRANAQAARINMECAELTEIKVGSRRSSLSHQLSNSRRGSRRPSAVSVATKQWQEAAEEEHSPDAASSLLPSGFETSPARIREEVEVEDADCEASSGPPMSLLQQAIAGVSTGAGDSDETRAPSPPDSPRTVASDDEGGDRFAKFAFSAMCALKAGRRWRYVVRYRRMTLRQRIAHSLRGFGRLAVLFCFGNEFTKDGRTMMLAPYEDPLVVRQLPTFNVVWVHAAALTYFFGTGYINFLYAAKFTDEMAADWMGANSTGLAIKYLGTDLLQALIVATVSFVVARGWRRRHAPPPGFIPLATLSPKQQAMLEEPPAASPVLSRGHRHGMGGIFRSAANPFKITDTPTSRSRQSSLREGKDCDGDVPHNAGKPSAPPPFAPTPAPGGAAISNSYTTYNINVNIVGQNGSAARADAASIIQAMGQQQQAPVLGTPVDSTAFALC